MYKNTNKLMGWVFRKKIRLGKGLPSLNLSKSGLSVSTGVKGLRFTKRIVGKGPDRLHVGRFGVYYRKDFSNKKGTKKLQQKEEKPEWLIQEGNNKEFFHSDEGLSPINILREKANAYKKVKDFQKAEGLYKKIAKMTRMGFDYCALGDIFYKQDKFKEAIKAYEEAIKLEPIAPYPKNAIEKMKRKQETQNKK